MADPVNARQQFIDTFAREHATTMKVARAFPPDRGDFRPHERSSPARQLLATFVREQEMIRRALSGNFQLGAGMPELPDGVGELVQRFDADFTTLLAELQSAPDDAFRGTVTFYAGPGKTADYPVLQFMWFMLHDQIHHRGQLSVYVRMAGGKVPSIYGPSADEPWG